VSTTTETPAGPSREPIDRPRVKIPGFGQAPMPPRSSAAAETDPTPPGAATMPAREPGSSPGPGRTPTITGTTGTTPTSSPYLDVSGAELGERFDEPATLRRGRLGRRTSSSTGDDGPTAKDLAKAIAGCLAILAGAAAWSVSRRRGWTLRPPDERERMAVADPLARIIDRHVGAAFITPDLVDGIAAGAAVGAYIATNPLTYEGRDDRPDTFDPELPDDRYQEP